MNENDSTRTQPIGINHVALEVGDIDEAVVFYQNLFLFEIRSRSDSAAFLDLGDQFVTLVKTEAALEAEDRGQHFGLVVADIDRAQQRLDSQDVEQVSSGFVDFRDPWKNRVQLFEYEADQFTKADHVLAGMGLSDMGKAESVVGELAEKGMNSER